MELKSAFCFLGLLIAHASFAATTSELNQRLGACTAVTAAAAKAACFERVARDALVELEAKPAVAVEPINPPRSKYADFIVKAKNQITRDLFDPTGVQWRNLFVSESKSGPVLCGELNGKNRYGAFIGYRKFFSTTVPMLQHLDDPKYPGVLEKMWDGMCANEVEVVE